MFKKIKVLFLSFFRELFVFHHSSLEFRAKLIAAMISSNPKCGECEKNSLEQIAKQIYNGQEDRVQVLIHTTMEYVHKVLEQSDLHIDGLILNIDKELKEVKRFIDKIDIKMLKRFMDCNDDDEVKLLQTRIIEYLENEIKYRKTRSEDDD